MEETKKEIIEALLNDKFEQTNHNRKIIKDDESRTSYTKVEDTYNYFFYDKYIEVTLTITENKYKEVFKD